MYKNDHKLKRDVNAKEKEKTKANIEKWLFADSHRNTTLKEWQFLYCIKAENVFDDAAGRKSNLFKLFERICGTMN